jgi:integrase
MPFIMDRVHNRKGSNKLFIDFRYLSERCRELTALDDRAANRKKLDNLLKRIEAEITLGSFDYAAYLPGNKNLAKFAEPSLATLSLNSNQHSKGACLKGFCEVWFQKWTHHGDDLIALRLEVFETANSSLYLAI